MRLMSLTPLRYSRSSPLLLLLWLRSSSRVLGTIRARGGLICVSCS